MGEMGAVEDSSKLPAKPSATEMVRTAHQHFLLLAFM